MANNFVPPAVCSTNTWICISPPERPICTYSILLVAVKSTVLVGRFKELNGDAIAANLSQAATNLANYPGWGWAVYRGSEGGAGFMGKYLIRDGRPPSRTIP